MSKIQNPILRGFNPDPAMIRVGDDYFIAVSTFEWFPGVQIHHSKDLKNWRLVSHALTRTSQLDMKGAPDSCGVWAPCLTYDNGTFYLVYSNVKMFDGYWKDTPNYLATTTDIFGEWSEPIYLNSSGFDGSMYHDEDGRKWYLSMIVDHRKGKFFGGIIAQEYSVEEKKLVGPVHHIFEGSELGLTEGPHIYKRNGYYHLVTAEGGTEYGHAVTMARSKNLLGPYEIHPENPVISSRDFPEAYLQKTGHASLIDTPDGDWYMAFLTGRPLTEKGRCTLGRETAIEKMVWKEDDWLYLEHGGKHAQEFVPAPNLPEVVWDKTPEKEDFDCDKLPLHFNSLRVPATEDWVSLNERSGHLRIHGRQSLCSFQDTSMIARRAQAYNYDASCVMDFAPENFQQVAGLICYYNTTHFHYLNVYFDQYKGTKHIQILSNDKSNYTEIPEQLVDITGVDRIWMKAEVRRDKLQFFYSTDGENFQKIGDVLDYSILSDDYIQDDNGRYRAAFTGSFVGMCVQDLSGNNLHADFDWFEYKELNVDESQKASQDKDSAELIGTSA